MGTHRFHHIPNSRSNNSNLHFRHNHFRSTNNRKQHHRGTIMTDIKPTNAHILHGNALERLKELPDNSVDSIITDPPYGLSDNKHNEVNGTDGEVLF